MHDNLVQVLKATQASPVANYVLYAEVVSGAATCEYPLETVRLPLSGMDPAVAAERLRTRGKEKMRELGFNQQEIEGAQIVLGLLPDDITHVLDTLVAKLRAGGSDLELLDFLTWEAAKVQLGQTPEIVGGSDEEMNYKGLRLRRSSAN